MSENIDILISVETAEPCFRIAEANDFALSLSGMIACDSVKDWFSILLHGKVDFGQRISLSVVGDTLQYAFKASMQVLSSLCISVTTSVHRTVRRIRQVCARVVAVHKVGRIGNSLLPLRL